MKVKQIVGEQKKDFRAKIYSIKVGKSTAEKKPNTIKKHGEETPKKQGVAEEAPITVKVVSGPDTELSNGTTIPTDTLVPDSKHPGQLTMPAVDPSAIQPGAQVNQQTASENQDELPNNRDVGGDRTDAFINAVRDAEFEVKQGVGGERTTDEAVFGLGNKSPEEWAKSSPQMATLLQFREKYKGTPYADQIEKRIRILTDRLDLAGEPGAGAGAPVDANGNLKQVIPPEQFDVKQLREADDVLLEKMRMIAGLG